MVSALIEKDWRPCPNWPLPSYSREPPDRKSAHYVTDIHVTINHLMGINARKLRVSGQKRIDQDFGHVIMALLSQESTSASLIRSPSSDPTNHRSVFILTNQEF